MSGVESFSSTVKNGLENIFKADMELCLILGVLVLLADVLIPSRLSISLLHIPVVGMACRVSSRKAAFMLIAAASVFTFEKYDSGRGGFDALEETNHLERWLNVLPGLSKFERDPQIQSAGVLGKGIKWNTKERGG